MTLIFPHVVQTCLRTRALAFPRCRPLLYCYPQPQQHQHGRQPRNFHAAMRMSKLKNENEDLDADPHMRDVEKETKPRKDPRINDLGTAIEDDFALIKDTYGKPTL